MQLKAEGWFKVEEQKVWPKEHANYFKGAGQEHKQEHKREHK